MTTEQQFEGIMHVPTAMTIYKCRCGATYNAENMGPRCCWCGVPHV